MRAAFDVSIQTVLGHSAFKFRCLSTWSQVDRMFREIESKVDSLIVLLQQDPVRLEESRVIDAGYVIIQLGDIFRLGDFLLEGFWEKSWQML